MLSAFGVEHGWIETHEVSKYHKHYGTNRLVEREQAEERTKRMAKLKEAVTFMDIDRPAVKKPAVKKTPTGPKKKKVA